MDSEVKWVAHLSNGEIIKQNDEQGKSPSWLSLRDYVYDNDLDINQISIEFYDHIEKTVYQLPENILRGGFYFVRAVSSVMNTFPAQTANYYIVGYLLVDKHGNLIMNGPNKMTYIKWLVPEILPVEAGGRPFEWTDEKLILNKILRDKQKLNKGIE